MLAAYREACAKTGEFPLPLQFDVPRESGGKINILLREKSFSSSVKLLAALSGMTVSLNDLHYRFEPIEEKPAGRGKAIEISNGSANSMMRLVDIDPPGSNDPLNLNDDFVGFSPESFRDTLTMLGWKLDLATQVTISAGGIISVETSRAADATAVRALVREAGIGQPVQWKLSARTIDLSPASTWKEPEFNQMDDDQVQEMLREVAEEEGAELMTMPSTMTSNGRAAKIEIIRELVWKNRSGKFEMQAVGKVFDATDGLLGFGHQIDFHYSDTSGEIDPATGRPAITTHSDISGTSFVSKNSTIFRVQHRPDGSKQILLVKSVRIEGTGRPVR